LLQFAESSVIVDVASPDAEAVIQLLADRLHQQGWVGSKYGWDTILREREHPTGLPTQPFGIAFPHADAAGVNESSLAVASMRKPVIFKNMGDPDEDLKVELVFMLANKSPEEQIQTLRNLALLFSEAEKLSDLRALLTPSEIVAWLKRELRLS
jgi:PTS system galactitol-specific IIA component